MEWLCSHQFSSSCHENQTVFTTTAPTTSNVINKTAVTSYKMKNRHLNLSKHLNRNSIQLNNWPVISCLAPLFKGLFGRWLSAASITTRMDSLFGQRCVAGECFSLYSFLRPKCSSLYSWPPNKDEWHEEQRPANVGFGRESVTFHLDFGNSHIL